MNVLVFLTLAALGCISCEGSRPTFSELSSNYPTYAKYPSDGDELKTAMDLPDWLYPGGNPINTCAIRMSKAFNDAGYTIDRSLAGSCPESNGSADVDGNGNEYIVRALFFRCYLRAIWGAPEKSSINSASDISGEKGLVIFTGCARFGQHIDLWNGNGCLLSCNYFRYCSKVEMYTLQ